MKLLAFNKLIIGLKVLFSDQKLSIEHSIWFQTTVAVRGAVEGAF